MVGWEPTHHPTDDLGILLRQNTSELNAFMKLRKHKAAWANCRS